MQNIWWTLKVIYEMPLQVDIRPLTSLSMWFGIGIKMFYSSCIESTGPSDDTVNLHRKQFPSILIALNGNYGWPLEIFLNDHNAPKESPWLLSYQNPWISMGLWLWTWILLPSNTINSSLCQTKQRMGVLLVTITSTLRNEGSAIQTSMSSAHYFLVWRRPRP